MGLVSGNYRLSGNSPGIDAGTTDTSGLNLPTIDLEGRTRINGTIDIVLYENPIVNRPPYMILDDTYGAVDSVLRHSHRLVWPVI